MDPSKRRIGRVSWGARCYVMGVLNVTPDSFSGDGLGTAEGLIGRVVDRAASFVAAGADILDVGGESTRPGSDPVSVAEAKPRSPPPLSMPAPAG